jgi:hypothetical protein
MVLTLTDMSVETVSKGPGKPGDLLLVIRTGS